MRKLFNRFRLRRVSTAFLSLILVSAFIFTAIAVPANAPETASASTEASESDVSSGSEKSDKSDDSADNSEQETKPAVKSAKKKAPAPSGSAGSRYAVTIKANYEEVGDQTVTFKGESYSDASSGSADADYTTTIAGTGNTVTRYYDSSDTTPIINLKDNLDVRVGKIEVSSGGNNVTNTVIGSSTVLTNFYNSSNVTKSANICLKNSDAADLTVNVTYNTTQTISRYSLTFVGKGDVGPYTANGSTYYQQFRCTGSKNSYTAPTGNSNATSYAFNIEYDGFESTRYFDKSFNTVSYTYTVDNSSYSKLTSLVLYYNDDETKTNLLSDETLATLLNDAKGEGATHTFTFANTEARNITLEATYEKIYKNIYKDFKFLNNCTEAHSFYHKTGDSDMKFYSGQSGAGTSTYTTLNNAVAVSKGMDSLIMEIPKELDFEPDSIEVYKRNSDGSGGDKIDAEITDGGRAKASSNRILTISGFGSYDDIIIAGTAWYTDTRIRYIYENEHPGDLSCKANGDTSYLNNYSYSEYFTSVIGSNVTFTYKPKNDDPFGSKLLTAKLVYVDEKNVEHTENLDVNDNSFTLDIPMVAEANNVSNKNRLIMTFTDPTVYKAEINLEENYKGRFTLADADNGYTIRTSYSSNAYGSVSSSYTNKQTGVAGKSNTYYLKPGSTYSLTDTYDYYNSERLILSSLVGYTLDEDGNVTNDLTLTQDEENPKRYTFTMPEAPIKIEAKYDDHLHSINVIEVGAKKTDTIGTPTVTAIDGKGFYFRNGYTDTYSPKTEWASSYCYMTDGHSFTVTPNYDNTMYKLDWVKAYYYPKDDYKTSGFSAPNSMILDYTTNSEGNITAINNAEASSVAIVEDTETAGTYKVTVPRNFDAKNLIICAKFSENDVFTPFKLEYGKTSTNTNRPALGFTGSFKGRTAGTVVRADSSPYKVDETVQQDTTVRMTMGPKLSSNDRNVYTNYVFNLKDKNGAELGKFRCFNGEFYIDDSVKEIVKNTSIVYGNNNSTIGTDEEYRVTYYCDIDVSSDGLFIVLDTYDTYVPLTVNQYVIEADGSLTEVKDSSKGFSTFIEKYTYDSSNNDAYKQKFFTAEDKFSEDYLDLLSDPNNFVNNFTVTKSGEKHNMLSEYRNGAYVTPTAAEGYVVAGIDAYGLNHKGKDLTRTVSYPYVNNAGACGITNGYNNNKNCMYFTNPQTRSQQLVINVYYAKKTSLTVNQKVTNSINTNGSSTLARVDISNVGEIEDYLNPFIVCDADYTNPNVNTRYISTKVKYKQFSTDTLNVIEKEYNPELSDVSNSEYYFTHNYGMAVGTQLQFKVTPYTPYTIGSVSAYKLLDDGTKEDIRVELVTETTSGSNKITTYKLDEAAKYADNIFVDIEYKTKQNLRVDVRMLDDDNKSVANTTGAKVTVSGIQTDYSGNDTDNPAFWNGSEEFSSFTVTKDDSGCSKTVSTYYNTKLTVKTELPTVNYPYVIANVAAYDLKSNGTEDTGSQISVSPKPITTDEEVDGKKVLGSDYSTCTIESLHKNKDAIIVVYLAKLTDMNVTVYTANDAGEYTEGIDVGDIAAYVNVEGSGDTNLHGTNAKPVITKQTEGNYNTDAFTITNDPASRDVRIIQGCTIKAFAMLPYESKYVISKVVSSYTDSNGVEHSSATGYTTNGNTKIESKDGVKYLKVTATAGTKVPPGSKYKVKIYIAPAHSIYTKATLVKGESVTSARYAFDKLTVNSLGNPDEDIQAPFTVLRSYEVGSNDAKYSTSYNAADYNASDDYTSEARCVSKTALSFSVQPQNTYIITSVQARLNSAKGKKIALSAEEKENGLVEYTLLNDDGTPFTMPALYDVYIDVRFGIKDSGKVILELSYTDDFETYKSPIGTYDVDVSATNNNNVFNGLSRITDASSNEQFNSKALSENRTYTFDVLNESEFSVKISNYGKDGEGRSRMYLPKVISITSADQNGETKNVSPSASVKDNSSYCTLRGKVSADVTYKYKIVLVPVANLYLQEIDNNHYGNKPEGVEKSSFLKSDFVHFEGTHTSTDVVGDTPFLEAATWKTQTNSMRSSSYVVSGTKISVMVNEAAIKPGQIKSVALYKGNNSQEPVKEYITYTSLGGSKLTREYKIDTSDISANEYYEIRVIYDCIDIYTTTNSPINAYIARTDSINPSDAIDIVINSNSSSSVKINLRSILDGTQSIAQQLSKEYAGYTGKTYFVVEKTTPDDEIKLKKATFYDYLDQETINFTSEVKYEIRTVNGYKRYYYVYEFVPQKPYDDNTHHLDNSMLFSLTFEKIKEPEDETEKEQEHDSPATVTLKQFERTSASGYQETLNGTATLKMDNGTKFTTTDGELDVLTVPVDTGNGTQSARISGTNVLKKTATLTATPPADYIVSKVETVSYSGETKKIKANSNGTYSITLSSSLMDVNVYYAQPLITISTNNTDTTPKGSITIDDNEVISSTKYMNSALVNRGDNKTLVIKPEKYQIGAQYYDYTVAYVLIGDARNNMLPIDEDLIQTDPVTKEVTVQLTNINSDYDIHVQFAGQNVPKTSQLVLSHFIKSGDTETECNEALHGTVEISGKHSAVEKPLTFDGVESDKVKLEEQPYVSGSVVYESEIKLTVDAPAGYIVESVSGRYMSTANSTDSQPVEFSQEGNVYTLENKTPNGGITYIDVKYTIPYSITYDKNGESVTGEVPVDNRRYFMDSNAAIMGKNTLQYAGHKFLGWSTDKNSDTAQYKENDTYTVKGNVTFYAIWASEENNEYKIVYNYKNRFNEDKKYVVKTELDNSKITDNSYLKNIINDKAPYITDMYKTCVWNTDNVSPSTNNVIEVSATQLDIKHYIYFNEGKTSEKKMESNCAAADKCTEKIYNQLFTIEAEGDNFLYWKATDVDENGNLVNGTTKVVCYTPFYSYRVTKDIFIEPVYGNGEKDWNITLGNSVYSREQFTNDEGLDKKDYVYSDHLISILAPDGQLLMNNHDGIKFGVILEKKTDYKYTGGTVQYPAEHKDYIKSLVESYADRFAEGGKYHKTNGEFEYFIYDRTDSAEKLTNMNRLDSYVRFDNDDVSQGESFNVYAYLVVKDESGQNKVIISKDIAKVSIYDCGTKLYKDYLSENNIPN